VCTLHMQVQCAVDVVIILFYAVCTVVGLYSRSRLLPLSMHNLRPVPYSTSLLTLLGNCAMLQTLSFALPVIVWVFGLGPREAMKVRSWSLCGCFLWMDLFY
jgi:hypothetical protein